MRNKASAIISVFCVAAAFSERPCAAAEWKESQSGAKVALRAVWIAGETAVFAVGDKGTILASKDGGATWEARKSPSDGTIRALHFTDNLSGFAVSDGDSEAPPARGHLLRSAGGKMTCGSLLVTKDGGETWTRGGWLHTNFELRAIRMVSPQFGMVCSHGGSSHPDGDVFLTRDGANFRGRRVSRGLNACFWADENTAWAVGSRVVVRIIPPPEDATYTNKNARIVATADGGNTWTPQDAPGSDELRSVWFTDKERGVAVGERGTILRTENGGKEWSKIEGGTGENLNGVAFAGAKFGVIVGDRGTILESDDGGASWKAVVSPVKRNLLGVHAAPDGSRAVAVGVDGTILRRE